MLLRKWKLKANKEKSVLVTFILRNIYPSDYSNIYQITIRKSDSRLAKIYFQLKNITCNNYIGCGNSPVSLVWKAQENINNIIEYNLKSALSIYYDKSCRYTEPNLEACQHRFRKESTKDAIPIMSQLIVMNTSYHSFY